MQTPRFLMTLVAASAVAACHPDPVPGPGGGSGDPEPDDDEVACRLASSAPAFDGTGVSVRQALELHWSEPIDPASVASQVDLKWLGGDSVPFTVEQTAPDTVLLHPDRSLWFWGKYAIVVGDGVTTQTGAPCEGDEIAFSTLEPQPLARPLRPAAVNGIAKVGEYVITASTSYRGLQVYDVSTAAATKLVGEVVTEQSPTGLTVVGDRAYAPAAFEGVLIFDVSSPSTPVQIGRAGTPGIAEDVAEYANNGRRYLFVADYWWGVRLLDVTDAAGPKDLGVFDPTGVHAAHTWAVDVQGDLLAVADGVGGLALVDIADPQQPVMLSYTQDDYDLYDVVLAGNVAYTSRGPLGVRAWDISDANAPVALANLPGPSTTSYDRIQRLVLDGGELFAATGTVGVERVSLDGTGAMTMAAVHDVPGRAWSVAVDASHIYAGGEAGLLVFDRAAATGAPPIWFDPTGHGLAREVALGDGYAYVAAGSRGLQTYSLADSAGPALVDQDDTPGMSLDVAASTVVTTPDHVLLGDGRAGMVVYDRWNQADPKQIGFSDSNDNVQGMWVVGDVVYACDANAGMFIADISDPASPVLLSATPNPPDLIGCSDILVIGETALLGTAGGLGIVDVSDPTSPTWLGWAPVSETGGIGYMKLVGDHLLTSFRVPDYEGTYDISNKLLVFDVSDPLSPELVWKSDDLGGAGDIVVAGDVAFLAGGGRGVFVFDIHDITAPELEGAIPTPGNANGLALAEDRLYVAQGNGGLVAIPVGQLPAH